MIRILYSAALRRLKLCSDPLPTDWSSALRFPGFGSPFCFLAHMFLRSQYALTGLDLMGLNLVSTYEIGIGGQKTTRGMAGGQAGKRQEQAGASKRDAIARSSQRERFE